MFLFGHALRHNKKQNKDMLMRRFPLKQGRIVHWSGLKIKKKKNGNPKFIIILLTLKIYFFMNLFVNCIFGQI